MASNLNPANAVTASRFLTLPPLVWAIDQGQVHWATLLLMVCGLLDLFDGVVARAFNCQTPFGAVFDAIADAICYGTAMLVVTLYGLAPWPPVLIILVLGVGNVGLRAYYAHRAGRTINYQSHAMERLVGFAAYLAAFAIARFQVDYFYWNFAALFVIVVAHDAKRLVFDPIPALPSAPEARPAVRSAPAQAAIGGAS